MVRRGLGQEENCKVYNFQIFDSHRSPLFLTLILSFSFSLSVWRKVDTQKFVRTRSPILLRIQILNPKKNNLSRDKLMTLLR